MVRRIRSVLGRDFFKIVGDTLSVARVIAREQGIRHGVWYFVSFRARGFARFLVDCYSVLYARARRRPLIYAIGDSHVKLFRGHRSFIVRHLGAATAHNLGKAESTTSSNRKLFDIAGRIGRGDVMLLAFGEIDCRVHIYYQYKKCDERKTIEELIEGTVSNYGKVLAELRDMGIDLVVQGVPPATKVRNEYRYPFYAPPDVHSRINRMFNDRLSAFCHDRGFPYIDVHSRFCDQDGFMLSEYAADEIHLNGKVVDFVKAELHRQLGVSV